MTRAFAMRLREREREEERESEVNAHLQYSNGFEELLVRQLSHSVVLCVAAQLLL
jgi:hypothetical protein